MAREIGVGLQDAVCGRVVTGGVHGVGAGLVEGCWESHIASVPASDSDFCHPLAVVEVVFGEYIRSIGDVRIYFKESNCKGRRKHLCK